METKCLELGLFADIYQSENELQGIKMIDIKEKTECLRFENDSLHIVERSQRQGCFVLSLQYFQREREQGIWT